MKTSQKYFNIWANEGNIGCYTYGRMVEHNHFVPQLQNISGRVKLMNKGETRISEKFLLYQGYKNYVLLF